MKHTYTAPVVGRPEYWAGPDENYMPNLLRPDELEHYLKTGWVQVGTATVIVDFLSDEQVAAKHMGALKAELQSVRAENQISKLQALTYVEPA